MRGAFTQTNDLLQAVESSLIEVVLPLADPREGASGGSTESLGTATDLCHEGGLMATLNRIAESQIRALCGDIVKHQADLARKSGTAMKFA